MLSIGPMPIVARTTVPAIGLLILIGMLIHMPRQTKLTL